MPLTVTAWAEALASLVWTTRIRPKLFPLALVILFDLWLGLLAVSHLLIRALPAFSAGALAVWRAPFIAVPALNGLARWRDRGIASLPYKVRRRS